MKWSKKENIMKMSFFVIMLAVIGYFIYIETWLLPVKVIIFILAIFILKSVLFSKKQ